MAALDENKIFLKRSFQQHKNNYFSNNITEHLLCVCAPVVKGRSLKYLQRKPQYQVSNLSECRRIRSSSRHHYINQKRQTGFSVERIRCQCPHGSVLQVGKFLNREKSNYSFKFFSDLQTQS